MDIKPRSIEALESNVNFVNPKGYWRRMAQIFGPIKRKSSSKFSALSKFYSGTYSPGLYAEEYQLQNKKIISEEIAKIIKNSANKHVNEFMRSDNGKALRQEVAEIVRMKIAKKKV